MERIESFFADLTDKKISRRGFLKYCFSFAVLAPFLGDRFGSSVRADAGTFNGRVSAGSAGLYDLVAAKGSDPFAITVKAIETFGGMERFVKRGSTVVIKPNIGWDREPEYASNTNPHVVAALVDLAKAAGAKKVRVFDVTCDDSRRCYASSGILAAAKKHGADIFFPNGWDTVKARFGYKSPMEGWPILRDAIECDTFINVPVLKNHGLTGLTLSMKNLMGVCGGNRGVMHQNIGPMLVDLTKFISPDLTVIDAYRILLRNGPSGGNLKDVEKKETVVVGTDPTLTDMYASTLAGVDPMRVPNIRTAVESGFGLADLNAARIAEISL